MSPVSIYCIVEGTRWTPRRQSQECRTSWLGVLMSDPEGLTSLQRPLDRLDVVALDHVALADVLVVGEGHAAFLAGRHLLHLILEPLERRQGALVDHHVVPD